MGCGRVALQIHLPVLLDLPESEVTAIAEANDRRRQEAAALATGAAHFCDYRELIDTADVDAVVICLPPDHHASAAEAALKRGLHVYVEKPLATRLSDARRILDAAAGSNVVAAMGFNFRFHPLVQSMRDTVRAGGLGEMVSIQSEFCAAGRELPDWKKRRDTGGGALLDLASHQFDLVTFVSGCAITEVNCMMSSRIHEEDTAVVGLRLSDGTLATVLAAVSAVDVHRMQIKGSKGALVFDRYASSRLDFRPAHRDFRRSARIQAAAQRLQQFPRSLADSLFPPRENSFASALAEFVRSARSGRSTASESLPGLGSGLDSLAVVRAAERSARLGRTVKLAHLDDRA